MQALRELFHRALASAYNIPGSAATSLEQHGSILDAITGGNAEEARRRMHEHLAHVERDIERTLANDPRVPEVLRA
jgi:DNA-binding FadR family transcriptional regulator